MKNIIPYLFGLVMFVTASLSISLLTSSSNGNMGNNTGMPGFGTCANCHGSLNTGGITLNGFPAVYSPGTTYNVTVSVNQSTNTNGFQGVVINNSGNSEGSFTAGAGSQTSNFGGTQLIAHSSPSSTGTWSFTWTAPSTPAGNLTFYLAANAANGDGIANAGDVIYSANFSSQPASLLTASVTTFEASCNAACDGSASISATGGNAPYSYNWSAGNSPASHPDSVTNLCAGTYYVTVYDLQNDSVVDTFNIGEPQPISFQAAIENTSCLEDSGSIALTFTGGGNPHTVNWSGPGNYSNTGVSISGLRAGEYVASIQDNNGCSRTDTLVVQDTASGLDIVVSKVEPGCTTATGSISLSVQNGTPPYSFVWFDGHPNATKTNLSAGSYSVTITESGRSCVEELTVFLNSSDAPQVTNAETEHVNCHGESTGSISLTVSSNKLPLTYSWSEPSATGDNPTGLAAGNYTVTITDNDSCSSIETYEINEPANPFNLTADIIADSGNCSGSIDLSVSGNNSAAGFTAEWNTPDNDTGIFVSDLCAGTYEVTVTDAEGCTTTESYEVQDADTTGNGGSNFVNENKLEHEIKMYPNPAVNKIFIEVPYHSVEMSIFDMRGSRVQQKVLTRQNTVLPVNLTSGMYLIQFKTDTEQAVKRLIISK